MRILHFDRGPTPIIKNIVTRDQVFQAVKISEIFAASVDTCNTF